jgi:hypothetical protein
MSLAADSFDLDRIRRTARRLETAMEAFRISDPSEFVSALRDHHHAVVYINERLFEAHGRLVQGHRDDALRAIEADPNVLDCLREVDTVDAKLEAWGDTLDMLEIPRPLRLLTELAEDLGREYDVQHQLATEMRTHRLLALAGGSLERRVSTLRRMLKLDPDNKFWLQDLAEYERHCQHGLQRELAAIDRGLAGGVTPAVAARVDQLCARLSDAEWQDPVDAAIVRQAQSVRAKVRAMHVRDELDNIGALLRADHSNDDSRRVQTLLSQWTRLADEISLSDDDPLATSSAEARGWASEVLDRAAAGAAVAVEVERLSTLCSQPTPRLPKAAAHYRDQLQASRMSVYNTAHLADRTAEVGDWLAAAERRMLDAGRAIRTFWLSVGSVAIAAVALIGVGIFSSTRAASRERLATDLVAEAESLRSSGRIVDVAALLDENIERHPWLGSREEIRKLRRDFERDKTSAEESHAELDRAIRKAADTVADVSRSVERLRSFTKIESDVFDVRDSVRVAMTTLNRNIADAEKLLGNAVGGGFHDAAREKESLNEVKDSARKQEDLVRRAIAAIRSEEVDRIKLELQQIRDRADTAVSISDDAAKIEVMIASLERLAEKTRREDGLRGELAMLRDTSARVAAMTTLRRDLNRSSERGPLELVRELASARSKLPADLRDEATTVVESQRCVEAALAWSELASEWPSDVLGPRETIEPWRKAVVQAHALPHPYSDDDDFSSQYASLMELLSPAAGGDNSFEEDLGPLEEYLDLPIMQPDVVEIKIGDGVFYARVADVARQSGHFKDEESYDTRLITLNQKIKFEVDNGKTSPASHAALAEDVRETIASIKQGATSMERGLLKMMAAVLQPRDGSAPDPLFRAKLLTMIVDLARSRALFTDIAPLERLSDDLGAKVGDAPWVLNQDPVSDQPFNAKERGEAMKILSRGPASMKAIEDGVNRKVNALGKQPLFCRRLVFLGWADSSGSKGAILAGMPQGLRLAERSGDIYAVVASTGGDSEWSFVQCGSISGGKATLKAGEACALGRPVFCVDASLDKPRKK